MGFTKTVTCPFLWWPHPGFSLIDDLLTFIVMQQSPIVLLIDDDSDDQEIFSHALEKADARVKCVFANDGIHALEILVTQEDLLPDFIFIDLNPQSDGFP